MEGRGGGGGGGFLERTDMQECESTNCGKQDTRQVSINHAYVYVHLEKKSNKIWVVHWAPEALKLMNFLSENRL